MKNLTPQLRLASLLSLILLACTAAYGQLTPSQDSYTDSATATKNYGAKTLLDVDGATQITYIQFNLASIPAGASVSQATLKLYVNAVTTAGSFNVDYVNGTWTESGITYNDAPALGNTIASGVSITTADKNQYILVNVTAAVQAWLGGTANDGIALVANSNFNATFDSKENTTTSHPAELDIAYAGGDGTITGVTTASGSGLTGGGTSGTLNLSLTNACAANQVLQWNGSAWACAAVGTGTVTSVGSGLGLTGGPINSSGTLSINTSVVPQLSAANTFAGNQTVNGNLSATGLVTGSGFQIGSNLFGFGSYSNFNAFVGFAGNPAVVAGYNTGVGFGALYSNVGGSGTNGVGNTAVGAQALYSSNNAAYNTAVGSEALIYYTTGSFNTAIGASALSGSTSGTGSDNTAVGEAALQNSTTGDYNTAIGTSSGFAVDGSSITGSADTFLGYNTQLSTGNLSNAAAIGSNAEVAASNSIVLGGINGVNGASANTNVGIGTTAPAYTLDVHGTGNFTGNVSFASGQTFPGTGTVTSVGSGAGLTGGPITGSGSLGIASAGVTNAMLQNSGLNVNPGTALTGGGPVSLGGSTTLNVDTTKVPLLASANTFTGNQTVNGNVTATGTVSGGVVNATTSFNLGGYPFVSGGNLTSVLVGIGIPSGGSYNAATGYLVLENNSTGSYNTVSGGEALYENNTGNYNVASGFKALFGNNGGFNTASGAQALDYTSTGSYNTGVGFNAGQSGDGTAMTTSYNTFLGANSASSIGTLTNATAIGANAEVAASNALVLGSINGVNSATASTNVGIGTTTPGATLEVDGPNQLDVLIQAPESGVGAGLELNTTGSGGQHWEILDTGATASQGPDRLNIRNVTGGHDLLTILANGEVGINTTSPDNNLSVNGDADKPGGGSWGTYSDRRLKTLDGSFSAGLSQILKINPVRYRYKEENAMGIHDREEHVGLVAQDVQKVIPEAVTENNKGYLLVNNDPIIWTMLNAIKEQQQEITALRAQLRKRAAKDALLESRLTQLEQDRVDRTRLASVSPARRAMPVLPVRAAAQPVAAQR